MTATAGKRKPGSRGPDGERSQIAILDAAYRMFASKGFAETTLADIAAEAKVAKGLVAFHFNTKEEVFRHVLDRIIPTLLEGIEETRADDPRPASELLVAALRRTYGNLVRRPEARALLRLLIAERHRTPLLVRSYHDQVVLRGDAAVRRIIEIGVARGEFAAEVDDDLVHVLMGPTMLAVFWSLLFSDIDALDLDRLFEQHVRVMLKGLERRA